ncbi:polysaccharide deacetylase family protein [Paraferrimonas sp. SM1919]|uniref:polysaccharide deacetylase family protein n=1 Tax=Paraferrimonas sp. SM1919 TaxID=2662263 RepID=UPI001F090D8D|nr:polysaccharide deacetylase family protein [Paraferrimonas sp. SM1919]
MLNRLLFILALAFTSPSFATVILMYHHVAEDTPKSTSVTPAQFAEQMQYIKDQKFDVIPLSKFVQSHKQGIELADNTMVITFDDGYQDIADNAAPILEQHGFPYTLFVSIAPIESKRKSMMDWQTLNQLAKQGAEIANHSYQHDHLVHQVNNDPDWLAKTLADIEKTETLIKQNTGQNHKILAYPYGEYNLELTEALAQRGYAALGQHSGAAGLSSDLQALPRFPVAGPFANLNSLKVKMHSLPMPITGLKGHQMQLTVEQTRPLLSVSLDPKDLQIKQLRCFISGQGQQQVNWVDNRSFTIQAEKELPPGRSRYNCTAPSLTKGRYYWFSQAWLRPKANGQYPEG